ncbi:hypothetical protein H5410_061181 [Solanum commersonii]|uniref:Uncharacterized protein n=1 Tax=Solanum commersonii TaxID=4109 RepID=A0A9J5W7V8_SOLCO|nr:hypothetical protein H5410_061181 [Solanum commersonii]
MKMSTYYYFVYFSTVITSRMCRHSKYLPRESKYQNVHFQTIIIQDENYTIVESITKREVAEAPLPPPTKLNTLPFSRLEQQLHGVEFDLLAVVANCSTMQYTADQTKRYQEAIVIDNKSFSFRKKPFMFTMWDDLADIERAVLLHNSCTNTLLFLQNQCYFEIDITDNTGTLTAIVTETLVEK